MDARIAPSHFLTLCGLAPATVYPTGVLVSIHQIGPVASDPHRSIPGASRCTTCTPATNSLVRPFSGFRPACPQAPCSQWLMALILANSVVPTPTDGADPRFLPARFCIGWGWVEGSLPRGPAECRGSSRENRGVEASRKVDSPRLDLIVGDLSTFDFRLT